MFNIYIKDFNQNGSIISTETLIQTIPASTEGELKLINPIVKNEMGTAEMLDFSIESGKKYYDAFLQMKTYVRISYDGTTIFYGRVLTIDNNSFRGTRKIRCEGPISFLLDSPVEGTEEANRHEVSTYSYLQSLISNHNSYIDNEPNKVFHLGEVPGNYSGAVSAAQRIKNDSRKFGSDSWTDTKGAIEDLRSHYGGFLRTRVNTIGGGIYLDWMNHYFNSNVISQKIEVTKNILDISNVTEIDNIFTAIIPIGRTTTTKSTTGTGSEGATKQTNLYIDGKVLRVPDILNKYSASELNSGYHKYEDYRDAITKYGMIYKTVTFNDANTKEKLYNDACEWIKNNYQGEVTKFTIKAIDMHQIGENTSKIMAGDRVTIIYPVGDENGNFRKVTTVQTCLSVSYDLYHPENNSYTFGIPANILTKSYGVTKQAKSVTTPSSAPKPTPSGGGSKEKKWIDCVAGWLLRHRTYYTGPMPYKDEYGDSNQSGNYLYVPGSYELVKAWQYWYYIDPRTGSEVEIPAKPQHIPIAIWKKQQSLEDVDLKYKYKLTNNKGLEKYQTFNESTIVKYRVCEWVKQEYGYDLRTQLEVKGPKTITTEDGETYTYNEEEDPETGTPTYVLSSFDDGHHTGKYGPHGEDVVAVQDEDGNWHYYYKDAVTGQFIETSIRDLHISEIRDDRRIGWVVTEDQQGEMSFANPGEMTLAIENYTNGPLVTARLSGEVMYLGNYKTQTYYATSLNHMSQVCGDVEYVYDPTVPGDNRMVIHSGGGVRTWHAIKDPQTGEWQRDEQGRIKYAEFGLYDENVLTGGVVVDKLADGTVHTKISGDIVDIHAEQVVVNNSETPNVLSWMTATGLDISNYKGIITPAVAALQADVSTLNADLVDATKVKSRIASIDRLSLPRSGSAIDCQGYIYASGFVIGHDSSSSAPTNQYVSQAIKELDISLSGNTYTLKKKNFTDSDWVNVGTFSRATALSGEWSSGKLTVTASPQNEKFERILSAGTTTWDGNTATVPINVTWGSSGQYSESTEWNVYVNAQTIWNNGYNDNLPSGISIGSLSYTGSNPPTGGTSVAALNQGNIWSNASFANTYGYISFPVTVHGKSKTFYFTFDNRKLASGGNTAYGAGYTAGRNSITIGDLGTVTSNGDYYASTYSWNGISHVKVSVPSSTHSIDIPSSSVNNGPYQPDGSTVLNTLRNYVRTAISSSNKKWVWFTVNCGSASKLYTMDFS